MTFDSENQTSRMLEMFDNLNADKYPPKEFKYIGERGPRRIDGLAKASGKADYTMDIQLPGMLYMRFLMSPYPHAKILKLDTSKAEKLPGVRYVLRYDDPEMPEEENIQGKVAGYFGNEKPLAGIGYFEGQLIGVAVAADREEIAEEALSLINIEWEQRAFILDPEVADNPSAPLTRPEYFTDGNHWNKGIYDRLVHGDVQKGFAEADKIIEFRFVRRYHTAMGPERPCGVFRWNGDCPEVWLKHQRAHLPKSCISTWFGGIPMSKIQLHMPFQGASFGGWCQTNWNLGPLYCAAMVSKRTGKPVKYVFNRREDFYCGSMDAGVYYVKAGYKLDGTITAVDVTYYLENTVWSVFHPVLHLLDNTKIPHLNGVTKAMWVNKGPTFPTRCEMLPPVLTQTMVLDHVADALGMDPIELALINDGGEGRDMASLAEEKRKRGFEVRDSLKECVEKGKSAFRWDESWHKPGARMLANGRMHGVGFTFTHEWDDSNGSSEMAIRIERGDGTATILSMGSDVGVDAENTYCRIAADELGMRLEDMHYNPQFDPGFFRQTPDSSTNLSVNGWAVRHAARILRQKILEAATSPTAVTQRGGWRPAFPDTKPEELDMKDSIIFKKSNPSVRMSLADFVRPVGESGPLTTDENLGARCAFSEPLFAYGYHVQTGGYNPHNPRPRFTRQAHFIEVEVDTETGQVFVTRVVNVNDVGKVINRMSCEGQQYGGSIMGISRGIFEEVVHDPVTGVMLNGNLIDYKVATIKDVGPIDTILVETGLGYGPYGSIGIGEDVATVVPGLLGPAVYNAIGTWIHDFPVTPDKVLKALGKA
ncbi:MAG: xanthine dehydrogenase family protein molybdopterin-binding subunit [Dehalococcoidia bacterium]